jgi:hypothetical protein
LKRDSKSCKFNYEQNNRCKTLDRAFDPMSSNNDCTIVYMLPESPESGIAPAAAGAAAVDEDPPCASEPLRPEWQCHDLHASKWSGV